MKESGFMEIKELLVTLQELMDGNDKSREGFIKHFEEFRNKAYNQKDMDKSTVWTAFMLLAEDIGIARSELSSLVSLFQIYSASEYLANHEKEKENKNMDDVREELKELKNLIESKKRGLDWLEKFQNHKEPTEEKDDNQ